MASESVTSQVANDLEIVMAQLGHATTMARLAARADKLDTHEARRIFEQLWGIVEIAHNDIDVAREQLEA